VPERFLESPLLRTLGVLHGFSTRLDGVSPPPFNSLNMSDLIGDDGALVAENRRRLAWDLDLGGRALLVPSQVHGVDCALGSVTRSDEASPGALPDGEGVLMVPGSPCEADAVMSCDPSLALGVLTADCIPMLLANQTGEWVAAIHGGWRGTAGGILKNAVKKLARASGEPPSSFYLAIGPGIGLDSYEVGEEVVMGCLASISLSLEEAVDGGILKEVEGRYHLCLKSVNHLQGTQAGLAPRRIDVLWRDTYAEADVFFSHRRDRGQTGRHLNVIAPKAGGGGEVNWQE